MVKNHIRVYCRLKPLDSGDKLLEEEYSISSDSEKSEESCSDVLLFSHKTSGDLINNKPESHSFRFCRVFDQDVKQDVIFDSVAKPVVDSVLEGYNGTVFAYGQTGSGKTYSIIGGPLKHSDRGVIPRSIQYIFHNLKQAKDTVYQVFVSYFEIYNECGYDLIDSKQKNKLEDLQKVTITEDSDGNFGLRNLSLHEVADEEAALDLLFLGDTNRVTTETPLNPTSSRSHCVFTIHLSVRGQRATVVRKSKMNLVDLAGSERVYKSGIAGRILEEAKHINLSLHFLEQVIVALAESQRSHIPYRNSMMTTVLKDSLGGNCLTRMLATVSVDANSIGETVSTCRFAQRVALVKNEAVVNEVVDPQLVIAQLKEETTRLKTQLLIYTEEECTEDLNDDELLQCADLVARICTERHEACFTQLPADLRKIRQCLRLMRDQLLRGGEESARKDAEISSKTALLQQREQQIATLQKELQDLRGRTSSTTSSQLGSSSEELIKSSPNLKTSSSNVLEGLSPREKHAFEVYLSQHNNSREHNALRKELSDKYEEMKAVDAKARICFAMMEGSRGKGRDEEETRRKVNNEERALKSFFDKSSSLKEVAKRLEQRIEEEMLHILSQFTTNFERNQKSKSAKHSFENVADSDRSHEIGIRSKDFQQNYPSKTKVLDSTSHKVHKVSGQSSSQNSSNESDLFLCVCCKTIPEQPRPRIQEYYMNNIVNVNKPDILSSNESSSEMILHQPEEVTNINSSRRNDDNTEIKYVQVKCDLQRNHDEDPGGCEIHATRAETSLKCISEFPSLPQQSNYLDQVDENQDSKKSIPRTETSSPELPEVTEEKTFTKDDIKFTGDPDVDEEIADFYRRKNLL